jgi:phosphatidylserine/phosphatidylglycerophosphate/cardiolipin synthase-like enzyme
MAFDDWLDEATAADLDALAQGLLDGRIPSAGSAGSIQLAGFGHAAVQFIQGMDGTKPDTIAWTLRRLARERRAAEDRYASVARLVWSGASEDDEAIRDTRVVLGDLFGRAERHVLISTLVVYNGRAVFAPLAARLRARPGIKVDLFVNLTSKTGRDEDEAAEVRSFLDKFAREHWPGDVPLPSLYYDPEARKLGAKRTKLHAKCVVIDEQLAFVTSANFTEAAQDRNIEVGVLLDHPAIAEALAERFRRLRETGTLKQMRPPTA